VWYSFKELERTQWLSNLDLEKLQIKRLKALIQHAYQNVPYYHRRFKKLKLKPCDIRTIEDIVKLPILTKKDVRKNLPDLIARNISRQKILPSSTAGSTGEPLRFFTCLDSQNRGIAAQLRALKWYQINMRDNIAEIYGTPPEASEHDLSIMLKDLIRKRIKLNSYNLSHESMAKFAKKLQSFKPKAIMAFASSAYLFARYVIENRIEGIRPKVTVSTGEKLYDFQRESIKKAFACEVFDFYGSREVLSMASQCPEQTGYHVSAENMLLEIIKGGQQVSSNEIGKVLVTDFYNYAMPFIRYENGDLACQSGEKCSCGRGLPLIKSIEGRISSIISLNDGRFVVSPGFTYVFKDLPVEWYKIVQETRDKFLIKVVKGDGFSANDTISIIKKMREYLGNVEVKVEFLQNKPISRSGKWNVVESKVPVTFV
jgi:phenylacetate-CoA ligase